MINLTFSVPGSGEAEGLGIPGKETIYYSLLRIRYCNFKLTDHVSNALKKLPCVIVTVNIIPRGIKYVPW